MLEKELKFIEQLEKISAVPNLPAKPPQPVTSPKKSLLSRVGSIAGKGLTAGFGVLEAKSGYDEGRLEAMQELGRVPKLATIQEELLKPVFKPARKNALAIAELLDRDDSSEVTVKKAAAFVATLEKEAGVWAALKPGRIASHLWKTTKRNATNGLGQSLKENLVSGAKWGAGFGTINALGKVVGKHEEYNKEASIQKTASPGLLLRAGLKGAKLIGKGVKGILGMGLGNTIGYGVAGSVAGSVVEGALSPSKRPMHRMNSNTSSVASRNNYQKPNMRYMMPQPTRTQDRGFSSYENTYSQ